MRLVGRLGVFPSSPLHRVLPALRLACLVSAGITMPMAHAIVPFISELHYDNNSGDIGEAIEITADAGADLGAPPAPINHGWRQPPP